VRGLEVRVAESCSTVLGVMAGCIVSRTCRGAEGELLALVGGEVIEEGFAERSATVDIIEMIAKIFHGFIIMVFCDALIIII